MGLRVYGFRVCRVRDLWLRAGFASFGLSIGLRIAAWWAPCALGFEGFGVSFQGFGFRSLSTSCYWVVL